MSGLQDRLTETGFQAAWRLVRILPEPAARSLFRVAADRTYRKNGPGVQRLRRNLARIVDEAVLEETVRAGMRSYLRYWVEAFRLPSQTREQHLTDFELVTHDELAKCMAEGKGVVLALPHLANWDAAGAYVASNDWPMVTVAERLKPEGVFRQFLAYREKLGMEVIPLSGGERPPLDVLAERLGQGFAVALLGDRDLSRSGVEVTFFGGRTRMPAGPAILAIRTGAPLYAVDLYFTETKTVCAMRRIVPASEGNLEERVRLTTQALADAYAEGIADHPQDWHMLQKLWL